MTQTNHYKTVLRNKTDKVLPLILRLDRIALKISIATILVTIVLVLLFGSITDDVYGVIFSTIVWYFLTFSFLTLSLTLPLLIVISAYRNFTRQPAWTFLRLETILFFETSVLFALLFVVGQLRD